jgi:hypothetical protein
MSGRCSTSSGIDGSMALTTGRLAANQREADRCHDAQACGFGDDGEGDGRVGDGEEVALRDKRTFS